MSLFELESAEDFKTFISQDKLNLVEFYGPRPNQGPSLDRIMDDLARDYAAAVQIGKISFGNVDTYQISDEYEIERLPTFIFFKNGEIVDKVEGSDPLKVFRKIQHHGHTI